MRQWFMSNLQHFFPAAYGSQSMHAGGATVLAEAGISPPLIQAVGWWLSEAFNHYIHKNPFLFEALLTGRAPNNITQELIRSF
jgi:hypothetical protein